MQTKDHIHHVLLLTDTFKIPGRGLFHRRVNLFFDRMELSAWRVGKPFHATIYFEDVKKIRWDESHDRMVLFFKDGTRQPLRIPYIQQWKEMIEQVCLAGRRTSMYVDALAIKPARKDFSLRDAIMYSTSMG